MADPDNNTCVPDLINDEAPNLYEDNSEVPEVIEPKSCCRCSQVIDTNEEVFDADNCAHHVCVDCRFREDLNCSVCSPILQKVTTPLLHKIPNDYLKDYEVCMRRNKITTDHIVNVELSTAGGSVQRQMCSVCQRVFRSSNARYHYMCASQDKPFTCTMCGKKFVKKTHVEAHLNSHYGIKPFKCTVGKCTASFIQKDKLVRHMKAHNIDEKYVCSVCEKSYSSQAILHFHMANVHSSTKTFQCDLCPRSYKYNKSLKIHRLKHQAVREYMCEICGKKYSLFAKLKHHKLSHVSYHRRPHKCDCGRRFMTKHDKTRHKLTHNSCRDFECSLCNTTFGRKDNLERHMKNFHENNLPKSEKVVELNDYFSVKPNTIAFQSKKLTGCKKLKQNAFNKSTKAQELVKDKNSKTNQPKCLEESKSLSSNKKLSKLVKTDKCADEEHKGDSDKPMSSVIVSLEPPENQQRPSVIKSVPKLLPYRVIPSDKRFLMLTDQNSCGKSPSDLMPPPSLKKNCDKPKSKKTTANRPKVPKDEALNRCFRIIHHTRNVQQPINQGTKGSEKLVNDTNAVLIRPIDKPEEPEEKSDESTKISVPNLMPTPVNTLEQEVCNISNDELNFTPSSPINCNGSSKCLGGPTLLTSLPEVLEANDTNPVVDNFSYIPIGESSCSTYTPYFESDCFRDGVNNCYEDFDMGFQYISEHFNQTEINLSADAKSVKYTTQVVQGQ